MTTIALEQARKHLETLGLKQAVEDLDNSSVLCCVLYRHPVPRGDCRPPSTLQVATAGRARPPVLLGCRPGNRARSPQPLCSVAVSPRSVNSGLTFTICAFHLGFGLCKRRS